MQIYCKARLLTIPHGEFHDGSPGFEAFQRAKSFGERFSLSWSSETLSDPAQIKSEKKIQKTSCGKMTDADENRSKKKVMIINMEKELIQ